MPVQRYTRPITKDDKSLKLEALEGNQWNASTFDLRFPLPEQVNADPASPENRSEAEQFVHEELKPWGLAQPIRIVPSTDAVNSRFIGGLAAKKLVRVTELCTCRHPLSVHNVSPAEKRAKMQGTMVSDYPSARQGDPNIQAGTANTSCSECDCLAFRAE
jgi:hypothetical protein